MSAVAAAVSRSGALARLAGGALGMWVCGHGFDLARAAPSGEPSGDDRRPNRRLLQALVLAGGGPADYKTLTLIGALAGPNAGSVVAALVKAYDARAVKTFIVTFDFVVADALRRLGPNGRALPAPDPDPKDAKALLAALYAAGVDRVSGTYEVDDMLDRLVSRGVRDQTMNDVDEKYGMGASAAFHAMARVFMKQLKAAA